MKFSKFNHILKIALADVVRTSLGPRGMDKMIQDGKGQVIITNDGATILKQIQVVHPTAKMVRAFPSQIQIFLTPFLACRDLQSSRYRGWRRHNLRGGHRWIPLVGLLHPSRAWNPSNHHLRGLPTRPHRGPQSPQQDLCAHQIVQPGPTYWLFQH